eukprot:3407070-Amphidinium_carterae.1
MQRQCSRALWWIVARPISRFRSQPTDVVNLLQRAHLHLTWRTEDVVLLVVDLAPRFEENIRLGSSCCRRSHLGNQRCVRVELQPRVA